MKQKLADSVAWNSKSAIWVTALAFFVSQFAALLPYGLIYLFKGEQSANNLVDGSSANVGSFVAVAFSAVSLFAVIWIFLKIKKQKVSALGFKKIKTSDFGWLALFALGYLILSAIALSLASLLPGFDANQEQEIGFTNPAGWQLLLVFISLVIIPPIVEEASFRGFLYRGLRADFNKRVVLLSGLAIAGIAGIFTGNLITVIAIAVFVFVAVLLAKKNVILAAAIFTSGTFGLVHGQWNVAIDTFILSMVMIFLYEKTKNLWACVFLHGLKNLVAFLALFVLSQ
jgi:membrane protease YdiL (CAAX protease family)